MILLFNMTTISQMSFWCALTPVKASALHLRHENARIFRDLPVFHDLRAFARFLEQGKRLARISEPVRLVHEMTEVHRRVLAAGGPALWFDKAISERGAAPMPVIANLFGTPERVAAGFGVHLSRVRELGELLAALRSNPVQKFLETQGFFLVSLPMRSFPIR